MLSASIISLSCRARLLQISLYFSFFSRAGFKLHLEVASHRNKVKEYHRFAIIARRSGQSLALDLSSMLKPSLLPPTKRRASTSRSLAKFPAIARAVLSKAVDLHPATSSQRIATFRLAERRWIQWPHQVLRHQRRQLRMSCTSIPWSLLENEEQPKERSTRIASLSKSKTSTLANLEGQAVCDLQACDHVNATSFAKIAAFLESRLPASASASTQLREASCLIVLAYPTSEPVARPLEWKPLRCQ